MTGKTSPYACPAEICFKTLENATTKPIDTAGATVRVIERLPCEVRRQGGSTCRTGSPAQSGPLERLDWPAVEAKVSSGRQPTASGQTARRGCPVTLRPNRFAAGRRYGSPAFKWPERSRPALGASTALNAAPLQPSRRHLRAPARQLPVGKAALGEVIVRLAPQGPAAWLSGGLKRTKA